MEVGKAVRRPSARVARNTPGNVAADIAQQLDAIERDPALLEKENYAQRAAALDALEFAIMAHLDGAPAHSRRRDLAAGGRRARALRDRLEEIDLQLFAQLRADIRAGHLRGSRLVERLAKLAAYPQSIAQDTLGYDALDVLVNGIWLIEPVPAESRTREPEMVCYQPTPARIILQMIERVGFRKEDLFYDLGSGLGHVVMLVNACTGARARGIEFEPAYCAVAQRCASDLQLDGIEFVNADVRQVALAEGAIFFMYTPFRGKILQQVLDKLRCRAQSGAITICTYGAIALPVSRCGWLERIDWQQDEPSGLVVFRSMAVGG